LKDAKLQLKKSQRKDYYKILSVEKDAGEDDIRKAYRKMALKFHPGKQPCFLLSFSPLFRPLQLCVFSFLPFFIIILDKNTGDAAETAASEAKFKEIGEAYAILSDPQKKRRYDSGADLEEGMGGMGGMDPDDLFKMFFAQQGMRGGGGRGFGGGGFGGFPGGHGHSHSHGGGGHNHGFYQDDDDDDEY